MRLEIFDVDQGSREWLVARCGVPTASSFHKILAKGKGLTRADYLSQLTDEAVYQDPVESFTNENMENGKLREAEACSIYALKNDVLPAQVGFIFNRDIKAGCSPDRMIGSKGLLQVKTSFPRLWVSRFIKDEADPTHMPQCQGELWVTEREWVDLVTYWPGRELFVKRIYRDEAYIAELAKAVAAFNVELDAMVAALRTKLDLRGTLEAAAAE